MSIERNYMDNIVALNRAEELNEKQGELHRLEGEVDELTDILNLNGVTDPDEAEFELMGDDSINCPRCKEELSQWHRVFLKAPPVGPALVCSDCGYAVTKNELREILTRPECLNI